MDQTHLSFQRGQEAWLAEFEKWWGRNNEAASAGLVAQADEAEAHLLAGNPPLFVFPGSLISALAPGTAALSRQIFSDELCFVGSQVRTSKSVFELVRESLITRSALMLLLGRKPLTSFEMDAPAMLPNIIQTSLRPSCHFPRSPRPRAHENAWSP